MRYSKQRELILNTVLKNRIHPTAENVYRLLKEDNPELSLGTVYRNLNYLSENNMLKKINVPDGSDRFDGTTTRHQHLICRCCGKVIDVSVDELEKIHNDIMKRKGFSIDVDTLVFEGICNECTNK